MTIYETCNCEPDQKKNSSINSTINIVCGFENAQTLDAKFLD